QASLESMTRDANNGSLANTAAGPITGGGQLNIAAAVGRTVGALLIVSLLAAGVLYLIKRFKLLGVRDQAVNGGLAAQPVNAAAGKGISGALSPALANLAWRRQGNGALMNGQSNALSVIGDGGMQIVGAQPLPGSGTTIYLVRVEDHMVLLGASYAGGVRTLAEWENDNQPETDEEKKNFESFLREQGITPPQKDEEEHTFASIRARLNSTADRLAGLRADFGA
ncbi:MAG TPA: flagellar biosynthetic protein FliO, partial [Capsulimonadaceae bacterium]|nr:flagellar biosynthetic protein FliO [Capsulimonadaceae bacterium]